MPPIVSTPHRVDLELTPIEVVARCRHLPGLVFFDSATESAGPSQISIVAAKPARILRGNLWGSGGSRGKGGEEGTNAKGAQKERQGVRLDPTGPDWEALRQAVAERQIPARQDDGLPHGFAAGFVEYEGDFCFGFYEAALIYRHADESWHEIGRFLPLPEPAQAPSLAGRPEQPAASEPRFLATLEEAAFCAMVERAQAYIGSGDIYQVNLAHRFEAQWAGDGLAFYEALRHYSPAPFGALVRLDGRTILSTSPESFLKMSGRSIQTQPIKGTRPRRSEHHADEKSAYDLITSPKEIAELVMITDLERNDLGRVCEFGSVRVRELLKLERFEHVFHLVSTVEGQLRADIDHVTALGACFPGGSITGAPKKRAREIIAELEPAPRGVYTGALGWFGFNGESHFNIAIRTAILEAGRAHFHVGAGIVADSVPGREWQETLDKAAGILLAAERYVHEPQPGD